MNNEAYMLDMRVREAMLMKEHKLVGQQINRERILRVVSLDIFILTI